MSLEQILSEVQKPLSFEVKEHNIHLHWISAGIHYVNTCASSKQMALQAKRGK